MHQIGRYLKEKREGMGLTLLELSKAVGSTVPHVHDIESGRRPFPKSKIKEWAEALNETHHKLGQYLTEESIKDIERRGHVKLNLSVVCHRT